MVKHRKQTEHCKTTAKVIGSNMVVLSECPIGKGTPVAKAVAKKSGKIPKTPAKVAHKKVTDVPPACKGKKGKNRRSCAKTVCAKRPSEYRADCLKKAGLRS